MMSNPDYHKRAKGIKFTIKYMSPDTYLKKCREMGKTDVGVDDALIQQYCNRARLGEKMPMPVIDYRIGEQEGRHRAHVAKKLQLKRMPVLLVYKMSETEWKTYIKKHHSKLYKRMIQ